MLNDKQRQNIEQNMALMRDVVANAAHGYFVKLLELGFDKDEATVLTTAYATAMQNRLLRSNE